MLSSEFKTFYKNWLAKAAQDQGNDIGQYFNRFFTLFVVYNRLYAEATFLLARQNQINLSTRKAFPDADAATDYVIQFLRSTWLIDQLEQDAECQKALNRLIQLLESGRFYIKLDMIRGNPQPLEDQELLNRLKSKSKNDRATAILEAIYSIRCNMFHGHKGFNEVQAELLDPIIVILEKVIELLYKKLERVPHVS